MPGSKWKFHVFCVEVMTSLFSKVPFPVFSFAICWRYR